MQSEFSEWFEAMQDVGERCGTSLGQFHMELMESAWDASRAGLVPEWRSMTQDPPFPFTGDIFVGGKVVTDASWCAGYWKASKGGCVDRSSVTHWKYSNASIQPPLS